jgi:hypothetical protein
MANCPRMLIQLIDVACLAGGCVPIVSRISDDCSPASDEASRRIFRVFPFARLVKIRRGT